MTTTDHEPRRADVELRVPADGAYVSVLRTTTAGLAARLDFTIDEVEDLRIAVGEACALVLPDADPAGDLHARFFQRPHELLVAVSVTALGDPVVDHDSFAWQVLTTLASHAESEVAGGEVTVRLLLRSETAPVAG
jgi:serine/threonine-protein kinase RsbW